MTAVLTTSPNPAAPSTLVAVAGSGFPNAKTRLLLDGVGATTNIFRPRKDGTFHVGITVSSTPKTQRLEAQQLAGSAWKLLASTSVSVSGFTPPADTTPPTYSNLAATPSTTSAMITWNTNEPATGRVEYGTTTGYGTLSTLNGSYLTPHSEVISGLTANTLYHFRVLGVDSAGNSSTSSDATFTTAAVGANVVTVSSVAGLMLALADNQWDEIVVTNGTYSIASAQSQGATSLWIGSAFASRTRPVLVRAQTRGSVTFSRGGGGAQAIRFMSGAHDQTWDGFVFANTAVSQSGVIFFGGTLDEVGAYNITMQYCTVDGTNTRNAGSGTTSDHALYFSYASGGGCHDIVIDHYTVVATNASTGLQSGVHADHGYPSDGTPGNVNAHHVTISNFTFSGNASIATQQPFILWQPPLHDWTLNGATITNAGDTAVRYEPIGGSNNVISNVTSTGSTSHGFYSSLGSFGSISGLSGSGNSFG